jgi:hypothetical protein
VFVSNLNIKKNIANRMDLFCSELAQKTRAEREAKRALHAAGVAKKKEIISNSVAIKSDRQVN